MPFSLILLLTACCSAVESPIATWFSVYEDACHSITVSGLVADGKVPKQIYRADGSTSKTKALPVLGTEWSVVHATISNLEPASKVTIRWHADGPSYSSRTLPATLDRPIILANGGDMMHERKMMQDMTAVLAKQEPDLALLGGDLAYADGKHPQRWAWWTQIWHKVAP